jgi:hypothetical protein
VAVRRICFGLGATTPYWQHKLAAGDVAGLLWSIFYIFIYIKLALLFGFALWGRNMVGLGSLVDIHPK